MRAARAGLFAALGLLAACGSVPFRPTEAVPTRPATAASLAGGLWTAGKGTYLVRQSVLIEYMGSRVAVSGVMRLDTVGKTARLVGMDEMGVKWFDLSIDRESTRTNFLLPALERYPRMAGAVGDSVRRIFLDPEPEATDTLRVDPDRYVLTRSRDGDCIRFTLGGEDAQLLEKRLRGPSGRWRIRYYEHQPWQGVTVPGGIVLEDRRAGYRLTLWMNLLEHADE
ncbi:MAG: hypothetical protein H6Q84_380 [Deltaproteobacteria bacterium]|nr:hypothetical protein [Deltaproteobacteria bacterium]